MYKGMLQYFYWKKVTHESLDVVCHNVNVEIIKIRTHYFNIFKYDTPSDDTKEKIDHWLDYFEKFHKNHITMPTEPYHYLFPEESRNISVKSPLVFINQENETRCYFNSTIQLLYFNVLFILLILNIDCYTMMIIMDKSNKNVAHNYQEIMIVK